MESRLRLRLVLFVLCVERPQRAAGRRPLTGQRCSEPHERTHGRCWPRTGGYATACRSRSLINHAISSAALVLGSCPWRRDLATKTAPAAPLAAIRAANGFYGVFSFHLAGMVTSRCCPRLRWPRRSVFGVRKISWGPVPGPDGRPRGASYL